MNRISWAVLTSFSLLCACTTAAQKPMTPRQAVERAADAATDIPPEDVAPGVNGLFDLQVRMIDAHDGRVFLNSERDYRDQRDLTIIIPSDVAKSLRTKYGASPETYFQGRHVEITGLAQRVTIRFFDGAGRPTGKYYFQTHVQISDPAQIRLLD
jgi:hypothetical protein